MICSATSNLESIDMGTAGLPGRAVLDIATIRSLSKRSNVRGLLRFAAHISVMGATGALVYLSMGNWYLLIPSMIMHGFTLVTMFAAMHECVHKTAFATPRLNEIFGWIAGLISFYNFHFYRYYHTWHHRYTQDAAKDPELMDPKPRNRFEYVIEISGLFYWLERPAAFLRLAFGQSYIYPFVPENGRRKVAISMSCQLAVYIAAGASIGFGYPWALYLFFLPSLLAQPLLRAIVLAEHTSCSNDENGLTNTRTTLTSFPIRLLMWNMPYHVEHHLYPSIPFHKLPKAHLEIRDKLVHLAPSYVEANRTIMKTMGLAKREV